MEGRVNRGRILISEVKEGEREENGVIIPEFMTKQKNGVVAVGSEQIEVGERVLYEADGTIVTIDDKEYSLLREADVLYIY